jgi:hypothetical protein
MSMEKETLKKVNRKALCMQSLFRTISKAGMVLAALVMASSVAQAALDMGVNVNLQGSKPASTTTPWVNTVFQDLANNTVQLTITAPNLTNPEFLQNLYLNFNSTKNVNALVFTPVTSMSQGAFSSPSIGLNANNFQAGNLGGDFDIALNFQTSGGLAAQFNKGDQVVFDITTTQKNTSLSSLDFAFTSFNGHHGNTPYYVAAEIAGVGGNGDGWNAANNFTFIGVPEPASGFAASGCCLIALSWLGRTKAALRRLLGWI